jgi:hypothetical protein
MYFPELENMNIIILDKYLLSINNSFLTLVSGCVNTILHEDKRLIEVTTSPKLRMNKNKLTKN